MGEDKLEKLKGNPEKADSYRRGNTVRTQKQNINYKTMIYVRPAPLQQTAVPTILQSAQTLSMLLQLRLS